MKTQKIEIPEGASFKYHVVDGKIVIEVCPSDISDVPDKFKGKSYRLEDVEINDNLKHKPHTECYPSMPKYKVGDWVWNKNNVLVQITRLYDGYFDYHLINYNYVNNTGYGVKWSLSESRKATDEEVKKALIEEAEPRYKKGIKFKSFGGNTTRIEDTIFNYGDARYPERVKSSMFLHARINGSAIGIWGDKDGWAKIIEPDYINSLGEVFYYGDDICHVNKKTLRICTDVLVKGENQEETKDFTEAMTKESAEKWIEENKPKYEDGCYYYAEKGGEKIIIQYRDIPEDSSWFVIMADEICYQEDDFTKIGDKIDPK